MSFSENCSSIVQASKTLPPVPDSSWSSVFRVSFERRGLVVEFGWLSVILLGLVAILLVILVLRKKPWLWLTAWEPVKATLPILGDVEVRPNHDTVRIAYQAWVEIMTRKAGLPFDEEHDVVLEVYNSWYELFGRLRELAKSIPAYKLRRDKGAQRLVQTMVDILNKGLRPHLTTWQAKYRRWYALVKDEDEHRNKSPQELQRGFPMYPDLLADIQKVNESMVAYAEWLDRLARGNSEQAE